MQVYQFIFLMSDAMTQGEGCLVKKLVISAVMEKHAFIVC